MRRFILVAFVLLGSTLAFADEASDFEKARNAYVKKDYVEATARFEAMLDPVKGTLKTKELKNEATFCYGAVKFAQGKLDEAHELWKRVILGTAGMYRPDPLQYPTPVLNDFLNENTSLNNAIAQQQAHQQQEEEERRKREAAEKARLEARVKELEKLASQETVIIPHSRLVAMLPFGIGQFQNGKSTLGWFFLLTEGAAVLTTFALFGPYRYNVDQYYSVLNDPAPAVPSDRQNHANQYALVAQDIRTADFITLGVLGALVIGGIVEAQIHFVPERTYTRPRKIAASIVPTFSPLQGGGAQMGLLGRF